jgi:hypothetical protein
VVRHEKWDKGSCPFVSLKAYGGADVQLYSFLTSPLDGEWLASTPATLPSRKEPPVPTEHEAGWTPKVGLSVLKAWRQIPRLSRPLRRQLNDWPISVREPYYTGASSADGAIQQAAQWHLTVLNNEINT